ncbi:coiled-coil domain-containing protein 130 [Lichtheimia corymbifera JMRC:FSU:9682]|uniref:Coiled-coil domain-containing protein 130 n=1 Tax=Lichtheimia corymbifera JMRC:FSU:9682 TaxID=1263082 RepID=A0A068S3W7_9FUNG|nr:coiled-coil domain-containing protein 130 [Lichtheimia corymbifera JMRC:FSU:9682]
MQPFNKYYPPDWTPDKGSVNKHVGKHPLGDRARKLDQGILVVRFELPFNIWCTGCENHIGRGVRYNAEKKKIGNYYSTPILQFRMKCHLCSNWIEIHTDPKNTDYKVVSGARKKVEEWEPEDTEVIKLKDEETKERLESDAMFRLEHGVMDQQVEKESVPVLTQLQQLQNSSWSDPYTRSQQLRRKFREQKKKGKALEEEADRIRDKHSLHIPLLPETVDDVVRAKMIQYSDPSLVEKRKLEKTASTLFPTKRKSKSDSNKSVAQELGLRAMTHTRLKLDPFLQQSKSALPQHKEKEDIAIVKPSKKRRLPSQGGYTDNNNDSSNIHHGGGIPGAQQPNDKVQPLVSYGSSDSDEPDE